MSFVRSKVFWANPFQSKKLLLWTTAQPMELALLSKKSTVQKFVLSPKRMAASVKHEDEPWRRPRGNGWPFWIVITNGRLEEMKCFSLWRLLRHLRWLGFSETRNL